MVKVNLVCVGSVKDKYYLEACGEYKKRLSRFCALAEFEVPERPLSDRPSQREIELSLDAEYESYKKHLKGCLVALDPAGKGMTSEEFSRFLSAKRDEGAQVTFLIGGSHGLCEKVKAEADLVLSFSRMTFPHTLFRVMLLEQLYRAFMIAGGGAYHK